MRRVAVEWKDGSPEGCLRTTNGRLEGLVVSKGEGNTCGEEFCFVSAGSCRLEVMVAEENLSAGSDASIVHVYTKINPFSFFLRDVNDEYPILIPAYGVFVTEVDDEYYYEQVEHAVRRLGLQNRLQQFESEPEESYEKAASNTRELPRPPIWMGLSRDMRIFEVAFPAAYMEVAVQSRFHGTAVPLPEADEKPVHYSFAFGRGAGCVGKTSRQLEESVLPILHGEIVDDDVNYHFVAFVALEKTVLNAESLRGTHFLVADGYGVGHMFSDEQKKRFEELLPAEMSRDEETVLYFRVEASNSARVPRYAWFKTPIPSASQALKWSFDRESGFGVYESGRVFCVSKLGGKRMPQEETAVLLKPGETVSFELSLPHRPVTRERAIRLAEQNFDVRHAECRDFWRQKLKSAAQVKLPERRVEEMAMAGLLHLDLVAYGLEPSSPVTPSIGVYTAIGSESSPIIQFMDSMGLHKLAERSLMFFLEKQHEDGMIQNFGGYMLETGAALWSLGEHYRYTHDDDWVENIKPKLLKACHFILDWRDRNKREELRGKGYGLLDGKVADPSDPYHQFMLNGYAYMGLKRSAEMLTEVDPVQSKKLADEADGLKTDIREALYAAMARSPVVPLGDGTWCPTVPPWPEACGALFLFAEKGKWWSHLTFLARDSLLGPLYLVFQEVIEPTEQIANWLVNYYTDLMHVRNVAFSQPYYSRHPNVHLKRGEVKSFLKAYYNGMASLPDQQTYTWWEHYPGVGSPHKTHEEAWFLMQTRWMLWMEQGETLKLLPGIPRAWLGNGKSIELVKVASYFGPVSLEVQSRLGESLIRAKVECVSNRQPRCVELRLPHPHRRKATRVKGGEYNPSTETVKVYPFNDYAEIVVHY